MVPQASLIDPANARYVAAAVVLGAAMLAEGAWPRRQALRRGRWVANLLLFVCAGVVEMAMPIGTVATAVWAHAEGIGLFNRLPIPAVAVAVLGVFLLDAVLYAQHRWMHDTRLLWQVHRVHHSDIECDVTTALRFHPLESPVTILSTCAAVLLLGLSANAVLVFSMVRMSAALFVHANVGLPGSLERWLRVILVTPELHRIHHSAARHEYDRNFGTIFSIWDRAFGTYCVCPSQPAERMKLGLCMFRTTADQRPFKLLTQPFVGSQPAASPQLQAAALPGRRSMPSRS